jgi:hypothetical protein
MTLDRVVASYQATLLEISVCIFLISLGIVPPLVALLAGSISAGLAFNRERLWLKNSS